MMMMMMMLLDLLRLVIYFSRLISYSCMDGMDGGRE